jgi:hypothetical protein
MRIAFLGVSHWHAPLYYRPAARLPRVRIVAVSDEFGNGQDREIWRRRLCRGEGRPGRYVPDAIGAAQRCRRRFGYATGVSTTGCDAVGLGIIATPQRGARSSIHLSIDRLTVVLSAKRELFALVETG